MSVSRIVRLEESVVNRIAAGEVVQRPFNAIKEMIENSLDAKANNINVNIIDGGLKLIQVQDDGTGIMKEDLDVLCERFATSKLRTFEDLMTIATYGFRGEALASISHVAHVTVVTKTADSVCAYKVTYTDGKPASAPKPCAGTVGTVITVENLFYNVPTRRKALTNPAAELVKVAEVVANYAVHNASVAFMLKKNGQTTEVRTPPASSTLENIRLIFGPNVARELIAIDCDISSLHCECHGYVSNANYSAKKGNSLLFINNRLVDSAVIRKAVDAVFKAYLPNGTHPFVYLSLKILPQHVDVNVHPTKHEVHFLHEDTIVDRIQKALEEKLLEGNSSRTMYTQALLPKSFHGKDGAKEPQSSACEPKRMVRTDSKAKKMDGFVSRKSAEFELVSETSKEKIGTKTPEPQKPRDDQPVKNTFTNMPRNREIKLSSIKTLKTKFVDSYHAGLQDLFRGHTFVGVVSEQFAVVQHETKLYLIDTVRVSEELFYQILVHDFGNIGLLKFKCPLPVYDLVMMALEDAANNWQEIDGSKESLAEFAVKFLKSKAEMLEDYFSLRIDKDGNLCSIPYLLDDYVPLLEGLPSYVLRLSADVDWHEEEAFFEQFCKETAKFYSRVNVKLDDESEQNASKDKANWKWTVEHVLYATIKNSLIPPKHFLDGGCVREIANLPDLYKVFERC